MISWRQKQQIDQHFWSKQAHFGDNHFFTSTLAIRKGDVWFTCLIFSSLFPLAFSADPEGEEGSNPKRWFRLSAIRASALCTKVSIRASDLTSWQSSNIMTIIQASPLTSWQSSHIMTIIQASLLCFTTIIMQRNHRQQKNIAAKRTPPLCLRNDISIQEWHELCHMHIFIQYQNCHEHVLILFIIAMIWDTFQPSTAQVMPRLLMIRNPSISSLMQTHKSTKKEQPNLLAIIVWEKNRKADRHPQLNNNTDKYPQLNNNTDKHTQTNDHRNLCNQSLDPRLDSGRWIWKWKVSMQSHACTLSLKPWSRKASGKPLHHFVRLHDQNTERSGHTSHFCSQSLCLPSHTTH